MHRAAILLTLMLAIFIAQKSFAQEEKQESYKKFKSRSSTQKGAPSLLKEADDLKADNPGEALNKVEEALGISVAQGDAFSEGKSYLLLGEINENIEEWKLALENYTRAHQRLGAFPASSEYKQALYGLGNSCLHLARYDEALRYFRESLALGLTGEERLERLLDVSEVYYQMGQYAEGMNTLNQREFTSGQIPASIANRAETQRAKISARLNDFSSSKNIYQNSLNTLRSGQDTDPREEKSLQNAKEEIVDVLRDQKKYDEEIDLRNQSIEYNLESNNLAEVAKDKVEISKTLIAKGENTAALKEMEEAARIADTLHNPKEKANAYLALARLYEKNDRAGQALTAYKKYSDAVISTEKENEVRLTERSELIKKQRDIEDLTTAVSIGQREEQATLARQELIIYGLLLVIFITVITTYFIYKNARASKIANQMLALKSLRSQMNPHFIFNALNSVNHFIAQQDERTANKFLSEFSQLMRLVLENSQEDFIPLQKEKEILSLYLKLEHYRFRDKFDYEIKVEEEVNLEAVEVPPMLIQPYIENAVWHGLRYKEEKGKLLLHLSRANGDIVAEISDNGIGRKKSAALKTENQKKHQSTGLKNIEERLAIINRVYKSNYRVTIEDAMPDGGTRVKVYLPVSRQSRSAA